MLLWSSHPDKTAHSLVGLSKRWKWRAEGKRIIFVIQSLKSLLWNNPKPHCSRNHSCIFFFHVNYTFLIPLASLIVVATNVCLRKKSDFKCLLWKDIGKSFCFTWPSLKLILYIFFFFNLSVSFRAWFHITALNTLNNPWCSSDSLMNRGRKVSKPKINFTWQTWEVNSVLILCTISFRDSSGEMEMAEIPGQKWTF